LATAGALVTVFDAADLQLRQDRMVAQRDGLEMNIVHGDMRDLSVFADASIDLVFHPISNLYVPISSRSGANVSVSCAVAARC